MDDRKDVDSMGQNPVDYPVGIAMHLPNILPQSLANQASCSRELGDLEFRGQDSVNNLGRVVLRILGDEAVDRSDVALCLPGPNNFHSASFSDLRICADVQTRPAALSLSPESIFFLT